MQSTAFRAGLSCLCLWASHSVGAAAAPRLADAPTLVSGEQSADSAPEVEEAPAEAIDPAAAERQAMQNGSYLSIDLGLAYDSNFTNQTGLHAIDVIFDGETTPIELDPAYRSGAGTGLSAGATGGLRWPIAEEGPPPVDADIQWADYPGGIGDGPEEHTSEPQ